MSTTMLSEASEFTGLSGYLEEIEQRQLFFDEAQVKLIDEQYCYDVLEFTILKV